MKNKKIKLILTGMLLCLVIHINCGQNKKDNDSIDVKNMIEQIKTDPINNYKATYWFSQLPFDKKLKYSKLIGNIILISPDTTSLLIAFGSEKSPYPWALHIEKNSIDLSANNTFIYIFRNDKFVQNKWGEYWTWQNYNTKINDNGPIFIEETNTRSRFSDLWIPASGWQYVGPKLEISKDTLNADKNLINTDN